MQHFQSFGFGDPQRRRIQSSSTQLLPKVECLRRIKECRGTIIEQPMHASL